MEITENQKQLLQHMLGADSRYLKKQWGFRNNFLAEKESDDYKELIKMESLGLVRCGTGWRDSDAYFAATIEGAKAIGFKKYQLSKLKEV